jgi:maltose alpha-D-glucosyltransferase/alpha-amylase
VHGDLHLGQVLTRSDDFVIIDFEGEPARSLAERRAKSSPLRDVVGMMRSFDYAPAAAVRADGSVPADLARFAPWAARWKSEVSGAFERAYFEATMGAPFVPADAAHLRLMLDFYVLERVIYEIGYESDNRPDWVDIPLGGLEAVLFADRGAA